MRKTLEKQRSYQKAMTRTRVMTVICINLLLQTPASASVEPWRWWWWCFFGGRSRFEAAVDDVFLVGGKLLHRLETESLVTTHDYIAVTKD